MKKKKLNLQVLKVQSFITHPENADKLLGGIYCPETGWDNSNCDSMDPHRATCVSTGNTDNPTGWASLLNEESCAGTQN